uniref:Uncharacterized protein n=1 Tax=Sphaerodactylus townsendi TaxID=933632 RepID=A0ACB8FHD3_9SAUR
MEEIKYGKILAKKKRQKKSGAQHACSTWLREAFRVLQYIFSPDISLGGRVKTAYGSHAQSGVRTQIFTDYERTSGNQKKYKIAICPQFAVAFKQQHSEALGGLSPGCRSRNAISQSSTLVKGGRADLATL